MNKVTIECIVPDEWIEYVHSGDCFSGSRYWVKHIIHRVGNDRLIFDTNDYQRRSTDEEIERAVALWRDQLPLPKHYYRVNHATVLRAWTEGVRRRGLEWWDYADISEVDQVMQIAILGKAIYG